MAKKPLIGITLDDEPAGGYAKYPWYALRKHYGDAVEKFGGVPLFLGHHAAVVEQLSHTLDGLVVSGGDFDIPPSMYGESTQHETVKIKEGRTAFEAAMFQAMFDADKPILGICGGEQLMTVLLGGTLVQDIPSDIEGALEHDQEPMTITHHPAHIVKGTLLHHIVGDENIEVNTSHHQSVRQAGTRGLVINAHAPDGVVEGIEYPDHRFCLGVQWHPEYCVTDADNAIWEAFIEAAKQ